MFTQLEKSTCNDFLTNLKDAKSRWIKFQDTFDQATEIRDLIKIYTNYASTGTWMKSNKKDTKIIAMATELYKERLRNLCLNDRSNRPGKMPMANLREPSSKRPPLDPWRFNFDGKTKTENGVKYKWCAHHGHKNDKGNQRGIYMEAPHDYPQWLKNKEEKHSAWKAKVAER